MHQIASSGRTSADVAYDQRRAIQRWGALVGGSTLALLGLTRRSTAGFALAAAGGALAYVGAKTKSLPKEFVAQASILLNCSPQEAYSFWHDFEELPEFMRHIESVTKIGNKQYRWVALGPLGRRVRWDAEITSDRPNELIAWRSLPGSEVRVEGVVEFSKAPADRGTIMETHMLYRPPAGAAGQAVAKMFGKNPSFLIRQDLRRMKALIETGEIPTIEGQTHGRRSAKVAALRMVNPDQAVRPESDLREVLNAKRRIA
jgi:uncharacterized membrane protein